MSESSEPLELTRGEFARRSGLSPKALRLYERSGLLVPHRVEAANGYRFYLPEQVGVAVRVRELRRVDMPLSMVAEVVAAPPQEAVGLVRAWWRVRQEVERSRQAMLERVCELVGGHDPQTVAGPVRGAGSQEESGAGGEGGLCAGAGGFAGSGGDLCGVGRAGAAGVGGAGCAGRGADVGHLPRGAFA